MEPAQTLQDHIKELRHRLFWVILAVGVSAGIGYAIHNRIIIFLQEPLGQTLYYSSPTGSFNFVMKISVMVGVIVALPVLIYNLLRFIQPALPRPISRWQMFRVIVGSFMLALGGAAFGFFVMLPMSLHFFGGYSTAEIKPLISADDYLSYLLNNLIIFALVFQIPLITLFINRIKPLKPSKLLHYQRHVIVAAFGFALVLPFTYDPAAQFAVAIPIILLYYLSILAVWITNLRRNRVKVRQPVATVQPVETEPMIPVSVTVTPQLAEATPIPIQTLKPAVRLASQPRTVDGFMPRQAIKTVIAEPQPKPQPIEIEPVRRDRLNIDGILPPLVSATQ